MNVSVRLTQPIDLGSGPETEFEFVDAKYHVDKDSGVLTIISTLQSQSSGNGNIASFADGLWLVVLRGDVVQVESPTTTRRLGVVAEGHLRGGSSAR